MMSKITKSYFLLADLPARWGHSLTDIGGWAFSGRLPIVIPIGPVRCDKEVAAGMVGVNATDVARLLFGGRDPNRSCWVRRIRTERVLEWQFITEPEQGIEVRLEDLMLAADARLFAGRASRGTMPAFRRLTVGSGPNA